MKSIRKIVATPVLAALLVAGAQAGQTFSYTNPFAGGGSTFANAMFESTGIGSPVSTIESIYTGTVDLTTTTYSDTGVFISQETTTGVSFTLLDNSLDAVFDGTLGSGGSYIVEEGVLTFTKGGSTLLNITFDSGTQTNQSFGSDSTTGQVLVFSGDKVTTTQKSNAKFSFGFPAPLTDPSDPLVIRYTSDYTSSIGVVTPVPEPASMAALALGGLAMLRRRRA